MTTPALAGQAPGRLAGSGEGLHPLLRHSGDGATVAIRAGSPITRTAFLHDVAALASCLPAHRHVVNLCTDKYRFMVGLAAALCRQQITLLPPNDTPGVLQAVARQYPDLYALTDREARQAPCPSFAYPDATAPCDSAPAIPCLPGGQPAVVLFTSGSTGRPVAVARSWGVLVRSALAAGARLGIARLAGAVVIGTVPHQHSYGLESTVMLALQHGLAVAADGLFYPHDIRAVIAGTSRPRILVTTPLHLRALLANPPQTPAVELILSATAPLSRSLARDAEDSFHAPLTEIYGCTEAGQLATRQTVREAAWRCLDGVQLDQDGAGTWASGPAVEGRALLQDEIELTGPGVFLLGGRSADLIDIAGKRMSLAHLNHQLLSIDGVQDGVFFKPEPEGEAVARLVALAVAPGCARERILRELRYRIDAAFLPRPLILVAALPRNALGKLPRAELLRLARS